jgi:hypothetical protein
MIPISNASDQSSRDVNPASLKSKADYRSVPIARAEHAEDVITRTIEQQSAKIPSNLFLFAALTSMGASLALELAGKSRASRFVGMWPPSLLMMGIYNKLVKVAGLR